MPDPHEGVAPDGTIRTGADARRVPPAYAPVLDALVAELLGPGGRAGARADPGAAVLLYGSVANGTAVAPTSDVDVVALGVPPATAARVATDLSRRFAALCRGVEVVPGPVPVGPPDPAAGDEDHGDRVFLRHYCVLLSGVDHARDWPPFPAGARAARGFNGDVAAHLARWRVRWEGERGHRAAGVAASLGRTAARKALLAVAGMVSVHDGTWTTDRDRAAERWAAVDPPSAATLRLLSRWSCGATRASPAELDAALERGGPLERLVDAFAAEVGLWDGGSA